MIITLNSVIGNGQHQGKTIREVMDGDPEFMIRWIRIVPGMRLDLQCRNHWVATLKKHEESKQLQVEVFAADEEIGNFIDQPF